MDRTSNTPKTRTVNADGLARGMEFALLTLLFLGIGYGLDRWFDTKPLFMIILVAVAVIGQFASLYYGYTDRMRELEAKRAASTRVGKPARNQRGKAAAS